MSVGRLERYKGHHRILGALPAILEQEPNARLVLVGSGPYEEPLRAMAAQLGVSDRVSICGFGPERRAAMGKLVAAADVFCLLSEYESHPVAVMEAVGAGTKALVADTSGLSELGRAGLATTIPLDASAEQVAAAALAIAAAPTHAPPVIPELGRLRRTVAPPLPGGDGMKVLLLAQFLPPMSWRRGTACLDVGDGACRQGP